jgi:hypothetical protein
VELVRIALGAVAVELLLPFHHVGFAAVFLDQPGDAITPLARTFNAFDAEHIELAFDVAENEIVRAIRRAALILYSITSSALRRTKNPGASRLASPPTGVREPGPAGRDAGGSPPTFASSLIEQVFGPQQCRHSLSRMRVQNEIAA